MYQTRTSSVNSDGIIEFTINTFTVDQIIPCETDENSPSVLKIPLKANGNWVGLMKQNADPSLLVENILTISNLKNPTIAANYPVSLVVYTQQSSDALETYSLVVPVSSPPFTIAVTSYNSLASSSNLLEFKFNAPIDLPKANRGLGNYYDEFTRIDFSFPLKLAGPPVADHYVYNLGYASSSTAYTYIPCWASDDLAVYGGGLKCQLIFGKSSGTITTTDAATVSVSNYKPLKANDRVSISFMVNNAVASTATTYSIKASLINIVTNEEFVIGQNTQTSTKTDVNPAAAFPTFTLTHSASEVQTSLDVDISLSLGATSAVASDLPAFRVVIPASWEFSTSIFEPTEVFLDGVQLFTEKFYYNAYLKTLYITPKDVVAAGAHTLKLSKIIGPPGGMTGTFDFRVAFYKSQLPVYSTTHSIAAASFFLCFPMPAAGLAISSDIPKLEATGASYTFTWTASKLYTRPKIYISLPTGVAEYLFGAVGTHKCLLKVNGVEQREDVSPYAQVCTFTPGTPNFHMVLTKDIPKAAVVTVALRYISHPAVAPAATGSLTVASRVIDPNTLVETEYKTECSTFSITNMNVFTAGVFAPSDILIKKMWGAPLNSKENTTLFFDFEIKSFLPRETELEFKLPDDFFKLTQSATPRCYLRGKNKMLKSCVANEVVNDMRIKMTLMDDFAADLPITLEFFGHVNFDKTGFTAANNKIGPFSAKATYNTKVLAQTPAAPLVEFTINDAVSSLASPVAAQLLPTPTVVIDPINEAERALYNFTVDFRQVINILE